MADNRFNQMPGYGGGPGFQIGHQSPSMPGMAAYMPAGIPINPMMQQQMMMNSRMRPPIQGMMVGLPGTPPPPYSMHAPSPMVTSIPNRPRTLLSKAKEGQQSEKERYFEEQRQKLRLFGKPGAVKVDPDKLIGTMFASEAKTPPSKTKSKDTQHSQNDDDGFGDFLQGPSVPTNKNQKANENIPQEQTMMVETATSEPKLENSFEKKDLKTMMLEYSDLSAPKKAKGFHKLTLNEVHKSGHSHQKVTNFHESDHSRSWKQNTEDLEGLFHVPVTPKPSSIHVNTVVGETQHVAYIPQQVMTESQHLAYTPQQVISPTGMSTFVPGYQVLVPPSGQPPSYNDVIGGSIQTAQFSGSKVGTGSGEPGHSLVKSVQLPGWCTHEEDEVPAVYKQVYEASVIEDKISTERLYPILLLSGLQREKLAQIWSLCNTTTPGQLTKHELWLVLALIALTQNNYDSSSQDILARCPVPPVPFLAQMQGQDASSPATLAIGLQQHQSQPTHPAAAAQDSSPTQAHSVQPSHTQQQKPQFHKVHHSKPLPHKASPYTPANAPASRNTQDEDDDFADFQAAVPSASSAAVAKGHTSPSFEDDDFTDGRDSLSQVSTSEQSENEDIRNFENYVEEYNQQLEKPEASSPHCPFPELLQSQSLVGATRQGQHLSHIQQSQPAVGARRQEQHLGHLAHDNSKHSNFGEGLSQPDLSRSSLGHIPINKLMSAGLGHQYGQSPASNDFKKSLSSLKMASAASSGVGVLKNINEHSDSKSAFSPITPSSSVASSSEVSLIGDEDKYGALRVLSFDNDFSQHSSFSVQSQAHKDPDPSNHESNLSNCPQSQEDDWADFSAAPTFSDNQDNQMLPASAQRTVINSKMEASTGSMFDDSSTSTSKDWGLNISPGDRAGAQNNQDSFMVDSDGDGRYHRSHSIEHSGHLKHNNKPEVGISNFSSNLDFSSKLSTSHTVKDNPDSHIKYEEKSGQFLENSIRNVGGKGDLKIISDNSILDVKTEVEEDGWCDFSGVGAGDAAGDAGAKGADELAGADGKGKFVTIKKQNLGTNEIMGLFKVRDDPATLSSYQIPLQQQTSKLSSSQGNITVGSSSFGLRRSSDFDDDLGPPPLDLGNDDDYDDHSYSRGYDLDDFMHQAPTNTVYNPFGGPNTSPLYSRAGTLGKLKESKEDSGSVHSLDLPSSRPTNRSSSDSQSVSSADLTSAEIAAVGVVSAESKSLDSLDLRSENDEVDNNDTGAHDDGVHNSGAVSSHHHPIQPQELLASMPDFADRYNIEREAQGSDRYGYEWERCLSNCCRMISEANTLFNMIDSSSVCNEVLKSSQGSEYVMCIIEIYRVVCRVLTSMRVTAISTTELEQTLKNIDIAWNNLSAFLVGTSLLPDQASLVFTNCVLKSEVDQANSMACGLCLLNVDAKPASSASSSNIFSCKLTYSGRQYHATCANFWVNCVDQTLPSLALSELL